MLLIEMVQVAIIEGREPIGGIIMGVLKIGGVLWTCKLQSDLWAK